ncbi:MAG TPA: hypothetical protein DCS97_14630 [Planctomycetes bacterium]|nr:hypothetical protein [Planctomycetota bacterium]
MRSSPVLPLLALVVGLIHAGDAPVVETPAKTGPAKPAVVKKLTAMELVAEDERWVFRPTVGRSDIFVDLEQVLNAQFQLKLAQQQSAVRRDGPTGKPGEQPRDGDIDQLLTWSKAEDARVRVLIGARKYEEAMRAADATLKQLDPHLSRPDVAPLIVSIRTYRAQAEEAKIRDDAQIAFEALKIRVLGILWSQDGSRMAIIDGESRAVIVNDRVKDCAVINIDQDRVDFRFVFGRRRFEFPVYVADRNQSKP